MIFILRAFFSCYGIAGGTNNHFALKVAQTLVRPPNRSREIGVLSDAEVSLVQRLFVSCCTLLHHSPGSAQEETSDWTSTYTVLPVLPQTISRKSICICGSSEAIFCTALPLIGPAYPLPKPVPDS